MPSLTCNLGHGNRPTSAERIDSVKSAGGESAGNSAVLEELDADGVPPKRDEKEGVSPVGLERKLSREVSREVSREGSPVAEVGGRGGAGSETGAEPAVEAALPSPAEESQDGGEARVKGVDAFAREGSAGGVAPAKEETPVPSSRKRRGQFGTVVTVRMGDRKALERIAMALSFGEILILQDLGEEIDSALVLPCSSHPLANIPFLPPTCKYSRI